MSRADQERAAAFLLQHARPLERRRYAYHFQGGSADDVLAELARFQNSDGGFGYGLEPDLRLADSSVIATTIALQILRELRTPAGNPLVQGALRYLLATYDEEHQEWPIVPPNVDDAPHAPWWRPTDGGECLANPRAEIVGYLHEWPELTPAELRETLSAAVLAHLQSLPEEMEMHDLLCYVRLVETPGLPEALRQALLPKLRRAVDAVVARDPASWSGYGLQPIMVVDSPASPFAGQLAREIDLNFEERIRQQGEDGALSPNWSWEEMYPEEWPQALREWKGVLTLELLKKLANFGRLAD